jgi:Domain of unknown function (DUF5916)
MWCNPSRLLVLTAMVLVSVGASAQTAARPDGASALAHMTSLQIPHLTYEPKLSDFEGMEPGPNIVGKMLKVDRFWQRDPKDGDPISQKTEAYLGYTDKNLYVVFLAFDNQLSKMRAHMVRREQINDDDQVGFFLDTFHDRRHAVFFYINPYGVQQEGTYLEGQDIDLSWDTIWHSDAKVNSHGWIGYFAIPFKSLRFKPTGAVQDWGFLLERDIQANSSEHSFFPRTSQNVQGMLTQEGEISGFENISPGRNMQFIPYTSLRAFRALDQRDPAGPVFTGRQAEFRGGLDSKIVLKDSLVLDTTINPDFGQVESDEPQITVNQRFEVFFPEKRPFFQENSSYFSTPINLVFTRRIADPLYGTRLTGKVGRWSVGTLFANDQSPGKSVIDTDPLSGQNAYFGVVRVSREIGRTGSSVGFIYTDREQKTVPDSFCTSSACISGFNRVGGFDTHIKFNKSWQMDAQAVTSETKFNDGTRKAGPAYNVYVERSSRKMEFNSLYIDNSPGFETRTGFFQRPDIRRFSNYWQYRFWRDGKRLQNHGPSIFTKNIWDHKGQRIEYFANTNYRWQFANRNSFGVYTNYGHERLRPADFSALLSNRDYPHWQNGFFGNSQYFKWLALSFEANVGQDTFFDPRVGPPVLGKARFGYASATVRPMKGLTVDNTYIYTSLRDTRTNLNFFNNHIIRSKWNYQFTREFSLRLIGQYIANIANPEIAALQHTKNLNADLLFTYLVHPGTAIYVGYNSNLENLDPGLRPDPFDSSQIARTRGQFINDGRQFFIKVSYLFRY